jgi:hypothetical protein
MKRLALLSTVLLVLLAACGSEAEPVAVTGVIQGDAETVSGEFSGEPIEGAGESWTSARDVVYRGVFADMSDDRVNGEIEHVMDMDLTAEGDRFIASLTITSMSITNDGGTWEGTGEGTSAWTENGLHVHNINYTLSAPATTKDCSSSTTSKTKATIRGTSPERSNRSSHSGAGLGWRRSDRL